MIKFSSVINFSQISKTRYCFIFASTFLSVASCLKFSAPLYAQSSSEIQSTEGIVGDVDKGRRAPTISFSTKVAADGSLATILVDTQVINEDFRKYPISVDFYVNGKLFSKQFRSLELPAPLGIDVPKELAAVPFNYAIVATLLHPNRQYVTVAQGALTAAPTSTALECTVTETVGTDATGVEVTGSVADTLAADGSMSFTLTQDAQSAEVTLKIPQTASTTKKEVTGTVVVKDADTEGVTYQVTGSAEASGSVVSSISAASGTELTLECKTAPKTSAATVNLVDESSSDSELEKSNIAGVLNAPTDGTATGPVSGDEIYSTGPNGETNFVPLDKVDGVEVVN